MKTMRINTKQTKAIQFTITGQFPFQVFFKFISSQLMREGEEPSTQVNTLQYAIN